jgi:hypothetical protein
MIRALELDGKSVRQAVKELNAIDKNIVKTLKKDLKNNLASPRKKVGKAKPTGIPTGRLRGFNTDKATGWSGIRTAISFRAGKPRGRAWKHIVSMEVASSPKNKRGIYIAELAGSRTEGMTPQGRHLVQQLNQIKGMQGAGGRFFYNEFRQNRSEIVHITEKIMRDFMKRVSRILSERRS